MMKRTFALVDSKLTIRGKVLLRPVGLQINLRDLGPRFERVRVKDHKVTHRSIVFASTIGIVTAALWSARVPGATVIAVIGGFLALICLRVAFRWISPFELERFFDRAGTLAFDVIGERGQRDDFDEFIVVLRKAIEECNEKPNKALEPTTTSVTSPAAQEPRQL